VHPSVPHFFGARLGRRWAAAFKRRFEPHSLAGAPPSLSLVRPLPYPICIIRPASFHLHHPEASAPLSSAVLHVSSLQGGQGAGEVVREREIEAGVPLPPPLLLLLFAPISSQPWSRCADAGMSTFREMYFRSQQQQSQAARPGGLNGPGSSQPSLSQCFSQPGAFSQDEAVSLVFIVCPGSIGCMLRDLWLAPAEPSSSLLLGRA